MVKDVQLHFTLAQWNYSYIMLSIDWIITINSETMPKIIFKKKNTYFQILFVCARHVSLTLGESAQSLFGIKTSGYRSGLSPRGPFVLPDTNVTLTLPPLPVLFRATAVSLCIDQPTFRFSTEWHESLLLRPTNHWSEYGRVQVDSRETDGRSWFCREKEGKADVVVGGTRCISFAGENK